jgi:hypothetical protein
MDIKVFKNLDDNDWESFNDKSNNGTIFHSLKFLQYHDPSRFNFINFSFYQNGQLVAILPGSLQDSIFKSPTGASYGSFITCNVDFKTYETIIDTFLRYCRENNIKQIYLTASPILYMKDYHEYERFLLLYKGFTLSSTLITHALSLQSFTDEDSILQHVDKRFRTDVNKSIKSNVVIEHNSSEFEQFYPILVNNKQKHSTTPTHSLHELLKLKQLFPNQIILNIAYSEDNTPIAGILLFIANNNTVLAFYIAHLYEFREFKAVTRLIFESIKWSYQKGYKWFDLGVSMDTSSDNPMEPSRDLIYFKESIKAKGFLRTTFHIKLD